MIQGVGLLALIWILSGWLWMPQDADPAATGHMIQRSFPCLIHDEVEKRLTEKQVDSSSPTENQEPLQYSETELEMICAVIQNEVGNFSIAYKEMVAGVIYNRLCSDQFPDTVYDVLHQDNQFTAIRNYYVRRHPIDPETRLAVQHVFEENWRQSDTWHTAVFYYNPAFSTLESRRWFENNLTFLFSYTEQLGSQDYTTRFFTLK
ncbi:MAG TPA: cell wall hydrolase [Firmicutes bacterium]|nr:cell wall hydrolase [Bacillota bacterium]